MRRCRQVELAGTAPTVRSPSKTSRTASSLNSRPNRRRRRRTVPSCTIVDIVSAFHKASTKSGEAQGNKHRVVAAINCSYGICYIRFVGTHQAYDRIDVTSV